MRDVAMSAFTYTILQIVPRLGSGGAERTTVEIAGAVVRAGGRALVATKGGRLADEIARAGGEVFPMPVHRKDPLSIVLNAGRIARLMRREKVDLVHARSRAPAWSGYLAARKAGAPFVTTFHGAHDGAGPFKRWYNSALVKGDAVIANSRYTGEKIADAYDVQSARLKIIPRGADLGVFAPHLVEPVRIDRLSQAWGGDTGEAVRFLLPARLTPWKGQELAIDAAARLKSEVNAGKAPALRLVLCGGAQDGRGFMAALRAKIDHRGVRDMVQLVGECADMPAAYAWSDAVIAPSLKPEPFGRAAIEAGAMGKPVIAAAHGGFAETIVDGETGLLVSPGDAAALAGAMARLAGDATLRQRLGDGAAARVKAVYSAEAMCDETLNVYRALLEDGA